VFSSFLIAVACDRGGENVPTRDGSGRARSGPVGRGAIGRIGFGLALVLLLGCAGAGAPTSPAATAPPRVAPLPPADWSAEVLYFVVLDRFADGDRHNNRSVDPDGQGRLPRRRPRRAAPAQLDEVAGLGATALWITPVVDNIDGFVTGAGFPDWAYHGYWADDFTRLDPRFGTEAELAALVAEAHERGIKVLLDVVYNHAGYDSRYLRTRGPAAGCAASSAAPAATTT
jgi:hypothetical protein